MEQEDNLKALALTGFEFHLSEFNIRVKELDLARLRPPGRPPRISGAYTERLPRELETTRDRFYRARRPNQVKTLKSIGHEDEYFQELENLSPKKKKANEASQEQGQFLRRRSSVVQAAAIFSRTHSAVSRRGSVSSEVSEGLMHSGLMHLMGEKPSSPTGGGMEPNFERRQSWLVQGLQTASREMRDSSLSNPSAPREISSSGGSRGYRNSSLSQSSAALEKRNLSSVSTQLSPGTFKLFRKESSSNTPHPPRAPHTPGLFQPLPPRTAPALAKNLGGEIQTQSAGLFSNKSPSESRTSSAGIPLFPGAVKTPRTRIAKTAVPGPRQHQ